MAVWAAIGAALVCAPASSATVPGNGWGLGLTDPDPVVARSLNESFSALAPRTFRLLLPWDIADHPAELAAADRRLRRARSLGVQEFVISFGAASGWPDVPAEKYRPRPADWIAKVRPFVVSHDSHVDVWGPANEPNEGVGWLEDGDGPAKLAGYYAELYRLVKIERHSGDRLLSPEFHDPLGDYATRYAREVEGRGVGDGFGDYVGWHPYTGTRIESSDGTDALAAAVPAGRPIWITEVGAVVDVPTATQTESGQDADLDWLLNAAEGPAKSPRVERIYYWHMRDHNPVWDTALVRADGTRRPAWYTWCAASHGGDVFHPDCGGFAPFRQASAPSTEGSPRTSPRARGTKPRTRAWPARRRASGRYPAP